MVLIVLRGLTRTGSYKTASMRTTHPAAERAGSDVHLLSLLPSMGFLNPTLRDGVQLRKGGQVGKS